MSSAYGFIKELIEKEKTPTPAYVPGSSLI